MLRKLLLLLILLLLCVPIVTITAQDDQQILRYPILADPEHLNPFTSETIAIATVTSNIYEGLIRYDSETGEAVPSLAERWEISENDKGSMVYTFYLREGVLFHLADGITYAEGERELTADDVLWNYQLALNPDENISARATLLQVIQGAEDFFNGEAEAVSGLRVIDDYTFEITLEVPDRLFLINGAGLAITSPTAYQQLGDDFNDTPIGTGPFHLVEWRRDDYLLLEAYPDYWNPEYPKIDAIRFINYADANTAVLDYREDQLDLLLDIPGSQRTLITEEFADDYNEEASLHIRYFGFNMQSGFLAENPLVRQALNYALDRETAWNILDEGARIPADKGILPPSMPASTPSTIYTYDLEKAAELLVEAGFPNGEGLPTIVINVLASISEEAHLVVWKQDLAELGVNVEFKVEDGATYWDTIESEDAMVFVNGWAAALIDPSDVFDYIIYAGDNSMHYHNPEVDELLEQARVESNDDLRNELYQQVHDIVMADSPIVVSAYGKITWLQKAWVEGFNPGSGGAYTAPLWQVSLIKAN